MQLKFSDDDNQSILFSKNYREFIQRCLEVRKRSGHPLSFAQLSRKLEISARSYPRDIVLGAKKISPALVPRFVKALGLTGSLKSVFQDLVELEEPSCRVSGKSENQILLSLDKNRARSKNSKLVIHDFEEAFTEAEIPRVYAALGTPERGATSLEIENRTGISNDKLKLILQRMTKIGLVTHRGRYFLAAQNHMVGQELHNGIFKSHFLKMTDITMTEARRGMTSKEKLFFSSAFSVSKKKIPELKSELRELLLKYVDDNEFAEGDQVVSLLCALH